jgi:hypothetical protein
MTEAQLVELLTLAKQMRAYIQPGDTMHGWWDWIAELECCAHGTRTMLNLPPDVLLAQARAELAKAPGEAL